MIRAYHQCSPGIPPDEGVRFAGLNIDESWDGLLAKWDSLLEERQYDTVLKEMQEKGGRENELLATLYRDIARVCCLLYMLC